MIFATPYLHIGLVSSKPDTVLCVQQRHRRAWANSCYLLSGNHNDIYIWKKNQAIEYSLYYVVIYFLVSISKIFHKYALFALIQEGLLSVTSESMCTEYWLTA